jgi:hypothetical protein
MICIHVACGLNGCLLVCQVTHKINKGFIKIVDLLSQHVDNGTIVKKITSDVYDLKGSLLSLKYLTIHFVYIGILSLFSCKELIKKQPKIWQSKKTKNCNGQTQAWKDNNIQLL